jgi:zeta-carotene desaturase
MWRAIRMGAGGRHAWSGRPFGEFLDETAQPQDAVRRFWGPIVTSACNMPVRAVDAAAALQVFQDGFLASRWAGAMGLPRGPLRTLYDPLPDALDRAGGEVRLGAAVKAFAYDGRRTTGVVLDSGVEAASAVVSALPFHRLDDLATDTMKRADARLRGLDRFESSPILGVHLWFEARVMNEPHLVLAGSPVHWLFNKGAGEGGLQHVHAVISAADEWMPLDEDEIVRRVVEEVHRRVPASKGLEPVVFRAIKEKRATFAMTPGLDAARPRAAAGGIGLDGAGISNLFLAGDWCDTGWPATMEGAVRSGYAAAAAVTGEGGPVGDLPAAPLARLLGLRPGGAVAR